MAPAVFKTVAGRLASWVGSIPIHSRHRPSERHRQTVIAFGVSRIVRHAVGVGALLVAVTALAQPAVAQRADTTQAPAATVMQVRPPLSPRRAFLTSLIAPGYAQSILGRPNAAALFVAAEAVALLMVRESAVELREARRFEEDSVPLFFVNPTTGVPDTIYQLPQYPAALVRARRAHLEDWIAALVANHLIAAADAFVAAHLWDVPIQVGLRRARNEIAVTARFHW